MKIGKEGGLTTLSCSRKAHDENVLVWEGTRMGDWCGPGETNAQVELTALVVLA
jgi:hypothetical protein